IERWRHAAADRLVTYVTFNYDTLLERAATDCLGLTFESIHSYVAGQAAWIIKPHGSVDWAVAVRPNMKLNEKQLIEQAASLTLVQPPDYRVWPIGSEYYAEGIGTFIPAIAIPLETTKSYECPDDHIQKLSERIRRTTKILVIGWRG